MVVDNHYTDPRFRKMVATLYCVISFFKKSRLPTPHLPQEHYPKHCPYP